MNHLTKYENINEGKSRIRTPYQTRLKNKFNPYSIKDDKILRNVWARENAPKELTKGKKYSLYAEFETGAMLSDMCFVVLTDNNQFIGFDSNYFMEEHEWVASNKYNL